MANGSVPWREAALAMLAMIIVLGFILIYYCVMPCLKISRRRREEEEAWWENDPRWKKDTFDFRNRNPATYSKLTESHSRNSSVRSNPAANNNNNNSNEPPKYSDICEAKSNLGTPPQYESKTPSVENNSISVASSIAEEDETNISAVKVPRTKRVYTNAKPEENSVNKTQPTKSKTPIKATSQPIKTRPKVTPIINNKKS